MLYVTVLRAINVAGHAIVKMTDLKSAFESAGCGNIGTFIQSGNVIFESAEKRMVLFENIRTELCPLVGDQPVIVIEKELGGPAKTRNWSTVTKIVDQLCKAKSSNSSHQSPII